MINDDFPNSQYLYSNVHYPFRDNCDIVERRFKKTNMKKNLILSVLMLSVLVIMVSSVSAAITSIDVTSPDGGEYWSGTQEITWTTNGVDGDTVDILYTTGGGWVFIQAFRTYDDSPYLWDTSSVSDGVNYQIIVRDSNNFGINDISGTFTIDNTDPTIDAYTIDNVIFSPNGDGVKETVSIDLAFSESVQYDIEIIDSIGIVVESWTGTAINPEAKVWDGTGNTGDGIYTIKVTIEDKAGNEVIDNSKTITLDTTGPTVTLDQVSSDEWMVDENGLIINAVCDDCVEKKLYVSDSDSSCDSYAYTAYGASLQTITSGKWVCAAAKDDVGNIGYSTKQYFRVSTTIQGAINTASPGEIINVAAGTYTESILIDKSLTLIGIGKPIITGDSEDYIVKITADDVVFDNFEVNGGGSGTGDNAFDYGIWIDNTDNVEVKNSIVKNIWKGSSNGIQVDDSTTSDIHDNTISHFHKRGIRYINSNGLLYGNEIFGESVNGVDRVQNLVNLWTGSNVEIYNNDLHNALTLVGSTPLWDSPAIFVSSFTGVIDEDGVASYANIHDNEIYNGDSGIIVGSVYAGTEISSADITNNNLHNLVWAINFEVETVSAEIHNNKFSNVDEAVNAEGFNPLGNPPSVNATYNWWGTAIESEIQALVYDEVDYDPWAEDDSLTRFYAPVLSAIGNQEVDEGSILTITLSATDQDAEDILIYSDNVEFGSLVDNVFTWTPTGVYQGDNNIITFTVSDGDLSVSEEITITVNNVAPEVEAGEDQTVDEGEEVSFTGSATDAGSDTLTYNWDFGDVAGTSSDEDPTYTYVDNGVYTVTLTVSDGDVSVSDTLTVTVNNVAPVVEASSDKHTVVINEEVSFTGSATDAGSDTLTYNWDFDDGSDVSTDQNPTHSYANNGVYTVTLTVSDGYVSVSDTLTITVNDFVINLEAGWNLISLPVVPEDTAIADVLGDAEVSKVYAFDLSNPNADNGWLSYIDEDGSLRIMTAGYGYWVYADSETVIKGNKAMISEGPITPPSRKLKRNWNLIGLYGTMDKLVNTALWSLGDPSTYRAFDVNGQEVTTNLESKEGYWLAITHLPGKEKQDYYMYYP